MTLPLLGTVHPQVESLWLLVTILDLRLDRRNLVKQVMCRFCFFFSLVNVVTGKPRLFRSDVSVFEA